jgi:hypothetical protein
MSGVTFLRHTFRGPSNVAGTTKIIFPDGSEPAFLMMPFILNRIYDQNGMSPGLSERAEVFVTENRFDDIIADLATQRTFDTGKFVAFKSVLNYIRAIPTTVTAGSGADPVVSAFTLPPSPEIEAARKAEAARLKPEARKIAKDFLNNLQIKIAKRSQPDNSAWDLMGLPELTLLADTVVMSAGFPYHEGLMEILEGSGWPRPKNVDQLAIQAQSLISIQHQIDNPPGESANYTAASPAKFIFDTLMGSKNPLSVSHDSLMIPLLTALGLLKDNIIPLFPMMSLNFKYVDDAKYIRVLAKRFVIQKNGSISTEFTEEFEIGKVKTKKVQKLAQNALETPRRNKIQFI